MKLRLFLLLMAAFSFRVFGQTGELEKNFKNPPAEYSLLPFWSLNGTLTPEKMTRQIDQMLEKGVKGAFLHPRAGLDESATPYFSEGYWKAFDAAIVYSAARGFQACLYDEDKWPSGSAGGRTVAANPEEFVKKALFYTKMEAVGPQTIRLNFHQKPLAVFAGRISDRGVYDFSSQVNLTDKAGGQWDAPEGRWAIISFDRVSDPHRQIDYLDSAAVAKFIEITHEEYFKRYGKHFGTTIPGIFFDEIYANYSKMEGNMFWTDDFLRQFKKIKGYDLNELLPLVIFKDPEKSSKVRYDYFDVVKDLYVKAWFKQYADWCSAHNIWATGHTAEKLVHYKREADYFSTIGQLQVPGADNEDYRYGFPRMVDWYNIKQISSIGNIFDRKRVMVEALGSGGYAIPLEEYRYGFSMLGVYGANMLVPHLFHYTTDTPESQSDWPPSWFYENPYWKYFRPLADFGSRISYMIAQGSEVCDVAVLYPMTDLWEGGYPDGIDDSYYKNLQRFLLEKHINYNAVDPESFSKATVTDGKIKIGRGNYGILILPAIQYIRTDVVRKINSFVENGGTVIALTTLPSLSESGPPNDLFVAEAMKELFGFPPHALRPEEYHHWNKELTDQYTVKTSRRNGAAFFTRFTDQLPEIIAGRVDPDIIVKSDNSGHFRFHHRKAENKDVFLFVNDRNSPETYHVSIRDVGIPSVWNAETGDITPFENYRIKEGRMEMMLSFGPRENFFLVLAPGNVDHSGGLVKSSELEGFKITKGKQHLEVEGWGRCNADNTVVCTANDRTLTATVKSDRSLPEIVLTGDFQFQLAPQALDYKWSATLDADTLELPVMRFRAERASNQGVKAGWSTADFDDLQWTRVKICDVFNKKLGVQRYLSGWDAWWICYYDNTVHLPQFAGGNQSFAKDFLLSDKVKEATIAVVADKSCELFINGQSAGADRNRETAKVIDIAKFLQQGNNTFEFKTTETKGILFQGRITLKNGKVIPIRSDESWQAATEKSGKADAFRFALPNMGPWGRIENPLQALKYPIKVWYRQPIPAGTSAVCTPDIKGKYALYVNGTLVNVEKAGSMIDIKKLMKKSGNNIAIRIVADDETCGLRHPLKLLCGKTEQPLMSWDKAGLDWYSGRAMYTKEVNIPAEYLQSDTRLILDLGKVNYFAEIWVNGQAVTFLPWGPFRAEIGTFAKAGNNTITVVVANMLINRASWNILDDNIDNKDARWWHDGSIMREKEKMESGLSGPLRIIPYTRQTVKLPYNQ